MDPATLYMIVTLQDGTMHAVRDHYESLATCQWRAEHDAAVARALAWCTPDRKTHRQEV